MWVRGRLGIFLPLIFLTTIKSFVSILVRKIFLCFVTLSKSFFLVQKLCNMEKSRDNKKQQCYATIRSRDQSFKGTAIFMIKFCYNCGDNFELCQIDADKKGVLHYVSRKYLY